MAKTDAENQDRDDTEIKLTGGGRTAVSRRGEVVYRETGPWAPTVHQLLTHLERVGFSGAPRVVGSGFDDHGRETLTYVDGAVVSPSPWPEEAMPHLGRLLRDLHHATESFSVPDSAVWRQWHGRCLGCPSHVIGHCDTGPWNIVARDGLPVALIDWEVAGPVDPMVELAQTCWLNAQLHDDDVAERVGLGSVADRTRHVRLILDGYGLPPSERRRFVDQLIGFAVADAADQAIQADVTPETTDPSSLWAITWRTRSAAWMLRHRATLERAIAS
jgi:hypothetical protein